MAKKTNIALIAGGGLVLAYIIMQKKAATTVTAASAVPNLSPTSLISQGASFLSNLFNPAPTAAQTAAASNPNTIQANDTPAPVISPAASLTQLPLSAPSLDITAPSAVEDSSGDSLTGFPAVGPGLIAALGCVGIACMPKRNSVSGFDASSLIVPAAIIIGGYLLIKNIPGLLTSSANSSNNSTIDSTTQAANAQLVQTAQSQGNSATLSSAQIASIASDIYNQGVSSSGVVSQAAQAAILADVSECHNLLDWANLKVAFGTKQASDSFFSSCNFLGLNCQSMDLDAFIKGAVSQTTLSQINAALAANGINYQL
jgi:hypothetical protein